MNGAPFADDEDLESLWPGLVASPRAGGEPGAFPRFVDSPSAVMFAAWTAPEHFRAGLDSDVLILVYTPK